MNKIAVQIDFDGTVTEEDVSFLILDTYVGKGWREYLKEYTSGKISVGAFNKKVFGMMKADKKTMTDFVLTAPRVIVRPGFKELIDFCREKGFKIVIVSNGLMFYIEAILKNLGMEGLEIHAAENIFYPGGMKVRYIGPDGSELDAGFKEAYTAALCREGYKVVYIGDGSSDIHPSRMAMYVFAIDNLIKRCKEEKLGHFAFKDFYDVLKELKSLKIG